MLLETRAARAGDADTERARALFDEAGELERHGRWGPAQERLRAALRLRETPHLYYALGWALENDDKLLEARTEYETAVRLGKDRPGGEEAARLATARLAELDKKTPVIKVHVVGAGRANARVLLDGRELRRDDDTTSTPVNPGSHVVRVERPGENALEQIVYVGRGMDRTLDVDAGDAGSMRDTAQERHGRIAARSTVTPASTPRKTERGHDVLPWLLLTGGVAFAAGGGALLLSADADADRRDAMHAKWCSLTACSGGTATRAESSEALSYRQAASDAGDVGRTKQAVGLALGGAGLVAGTVGAILLLRGDEPKEKPRSTRGTRPRASATPLPGGGFATATFAF
ncbi:MAG: hypothetical protein K0S65_4362 [Labilithrix sp.]|nr:hypothetical protein [Labilithrix sp.]